MPQAVHCYSDSYSSARSALTSQSLDDQRPPSLSYSAPSTVATSLPHHPSDCENGECYLDRDLEEETPTEQDEAWIGLADELPAAAMLAKAGEIPILSANGLSRPFKSLWEGPQHIGQRQLIIFIRHFYCAVSFNHTLATLFHHSKTFHHRAAKHTYATSSTPSLQSISRLPSPPPSQLLATVTQSSSPPTPTRSTVPSPSTPILNASCSAH